MKNLHSINKEQEVFVFQEGKYFSCLGFQVVLKKGKKLAEEMGIVCPKFRKGSKASLKFYRKMTDLAFKRHKQTGWKSKSDLFEPFIGNEGKRVEVTYNWGETERFIIGKSTGWIPCHLVIKKSNSSGGTSVLADSIKNFRFV